MVPIFLAGSFVLSACAPPEPHVEVTYRNLGEPGMPMLEIHLTAGKDYRWDPQLAPGKSGRARLTPGVAVVIPDERNLHMRYYLEGQPRDEPLGWYGPQLPVDVSYRLAIDIHPDGRVESNYCIKPCSLSN